jgi:hypothetical protein
VLHTLQQNEPRNTKSPTKPRLLTIEIQRQRSQRGVVLQSVTQRRRSFCADSIDCRHTRVERSKYEFSKTIPMGDTVNSQSQQSHSIHGGTDRGSPQSTLNSPTSGALHTLHQKKPGNTNHQPNQDPRLLTFQIQRQRSQRGVVLQSVTQRLRSFCADFINYRHTRVERSIYEFSKPVPMGDTANRLSQQSQQAHSIHGGIDRASPQPTLNSPTSGAFHTIQQI